MVISSNSKILDCFISAALSDSSVVKKKY